MLVYLLDENMSDEVAEQVKGKRPDIPIFSLHRWEEGRLLSTDDEIVIREATKAGLTLVTYDQNTIPPLLVQPAEAGFSHSGVIFIDQNTILSHDLGGQVRALIAYWKDKSTLDWTDRIAYLRAAQT